MDAPARQPVLLHFALGATLAAFILNLLLRAVLRLPGVPATLVAASIAAMGTSLVFARCYRRIAGPAERNKLVLLYAGIMGLLYAGLFGLMLLKDEPGPMGQLLFLLHYLCYPLSLWICLGSKWLSTRVHNPP